MGGRIGSGTYYGDNDSGISLVWEAFDGSIVNFYYEFDDDLDIDVEDDYDDPALHGADYLDFVRPLSDAECRDIADDDDSSDDDNSDDDDSSSSDSSDDSSDDDNGNDGGGDDDDSSSSSGATHLVTSTITLVIAFFIL